MSWWRWETHEKKTHNIADHHRRRTPATRDRSLERPTDEISAPCIFLIFQIHRKKQKTLCSTQISLVIMKNFRVVSRARTHGMISACTCVISHWHSHPIIGRARKDFNLPTRQARVKLFIFGGHATDCCNYSRESPWKVKKKRDEQRQRKKVSIASNSPASSLIIDARHEVAEKKDISSHQYNLT